MRTSTPPAKPRLPRSPYRCRECNERALTTRGICWKCRLQAANEQPK